MRKGEFASRRRRLERYILFRFSQARDITSMRQYLIESIRKLACDFELSPCKNRTRTIARVLCLSSALDVFDIKVSEGYEDAFLKCYINHRILPDFKYSTVSGGFIMPR